MTTEDIDLSLIYVYDIGDIGIYNLILNERERERALYEHESYL